MNRLTDLEVNIRVRRVLVRHSIDLGGLSIRTIGGVTTLSGLLHRLPQDGVAALNPAQVSEIMLEIQRTGCVRRIQSNLANWFPVGAGWQPVAAQTAAQPAEKTAAAHSPAAVDLTAEERELQQRDASAKTAVAAPLRT